MRGLKMFQHSERFPEVTLLVQLGCVCVCTCAMQVREPACTLACCTVHVEVREQLTEESQELNSGHRVW